MLAFSLSIKGCGLSKIFNHLCAWTITHFPCKLSKMWKLNAAERCQGFPCATTRLVQFPRDAMQMAEHPRSWTSLANPERLCNNWQHSHAYSRGIAMRNKKNQYFHDPKLAPAASKHQGGGCMAWTGDMRTATQIRKRGTWKECRRKKKTGNFRSNNWKEFRLSRVLECGTQMRALLR